MKSIQLPAGVEFTALQTARERARETARPDALFTDPLAEQMVTHVRDHHGHEFPSLAAETDLNWLFNGYVALRTHFLDDRLLAATEAGARQVVMLAAGMDGRGYRLPWPPGTRIFEVDKPELLDFKEQVVQRASLGRTAEVIPVPGDLNEDWLGLLNMAGFLQGQPTIWLVEGILNYLDAQEADRLVEALTANSASGSHLVMTYVDGDSLTAAHRTGRDNGETMARLQKLFRTGPSREPEAWLGSHGWTVEATTVLAWAERLGRPVPPAMDPALEGATGYLIDAHRS